MVAEFSPLRRRAVRVLATCGLLTFVFAFFIVVQEVAFPIADESALVPAGSPQAQRCRLPW